MLCDATNSRRNRRHQVLRPNCVENPSILTLGGFLRINHQTTMSIAPHVFLSCLGHVPHQSSTTPATRSALPHPRASACPKYQPPQLVILRLWSLGQVSVPVLHHSRSISMNPHDLRRQPPSLCSTPTHHKANDITHVSVSP
jgi:hypothetical protein